MWQANEIEKPERKDVLVLPRKTYKPGLKTQRYLRVLTLAFTGL